MADITNFEIGQGELFRALVQLKNRSNNNVPINITDYEFSGQVRENYTTDELAATFTITKLSPPSSGSVFISLLPNETDGLYQRSYVYDIKITSGSVVRRILEGGLTIRPAVTR